VRPIRILCDVDGVLADFVGLVLDYVQKNTGMAYLPSAVDQWDCFACLGLSEHWPYFRTQCDELGLCRSMRELPGAREFYTELGRIASEVHVCTSPMTPAWLTQRAEWLIEFGIPLRDHIHAHDKHELHPAWDVLIDDRAENCVAFVEAGGIAWCIATPYNAHVEECPSLHRGTHAECLEFLRNVARAR
jgi:5'(3')-deoxyribonucleotidase